MISKAKAWQEVSQALESLNYTRTEISQAMQYLTAHHAGVWTCHLIKRCVKHSVFYQKEYSLNLYNMLSMGLET